MSLTACWALASALPRVLCGQDAWCSAVRCRLLKHRLLKRRLRPLPLLFPGVASAVPGQNSILHITCTTALEPACPPPSAASSQHAPLVGSLPLLTSLFQETPSFAPPSEELLCILQSPKFFSLVKPS